MNELVLGANAPLSHDEPLIVVEAEGDFLIGEYSGLAWLPMDDKRQPVAAAAYLHTEQAWAGAGGDGRRCEWQLHLKQLPANTHSLSLIVYSYGAAGPLGQLRQFRVSLPGLHAYVPPLHGCADAAMIVLEVYRRGDTWKIRALAEGSVYGLSALGRRLNVALDERNPRTSAAGENGSANPSPDRWTGTGFVIGPRHVMTCAHVIDNARNIRLSAFGGKRTAEIVLQDNINDLALLHLHEPVDAPSLSFRQGAGCQLGEAVSTMGFPLAGVMGSGLQVTQGCISGLLGPRDDSRFLQFTAPIQPGSSGSPLFDGHGRIAGMVTSTITQSQNMNFAVKSALMLAFLEAVGIDAPLASASDALNTSALAKRVQGALWRIDCSG